MLVLKIAVLCGIFWLQLAAHEVVEDKQKKEFVETVSSASFLRSEQVSSPSSSPTTSFRPTRFHRHTRRPDCPFAPHPSGSPSESLHVKEVIHEASTTKETEKRRKLSGCDDSEDEFETIDDNDLDPALDELNDVLILTERGGELFLEVEEADIVKEEEMTLSPSIVATLPPSLQMSLPPFSLPPLSSMPFSIPPFSLPPFSLPPFSLPPFGMPTQSRSPKPSRPPHQHYSLPPFLPPKPKPESTPPYPVPPTSTE